MNLSDWLSDEQIERINTNVEKMVQDKIRQILTSILPPVGRSMKQINIGRFHTSMIHFFTVQFRDVILPDVFPEGIPAKFQPSTKIRENIFYAGVFTTVQRMFLRKILLRLYATRKQVSAPTKVSSNNL